MDFEPRFIPYCKMTRKRVFEMVNMVRKMRAVDINMLGALLHDAKSKLVHDIDTVRVLYEGEVDVVGHVIRDPHLSFPLYIVFGSQTAGDQISEVWDCLGRLGTCPDLMLLLRLYSVEDRLMARSHMPGDHDATFAGAVAGIDRLMQNLLLNVGIHFSMADIDHVHGERHSKMFWEGKSGDAAASSFIRLLTHVKTIADHLSSIIKPPKEVDNDT